MRKLILPLFIFMALVNPVWLFADDLSGFHQCENYQSINLEKIPTGHDVIDVTLNGVNSRFILDTGAKASVIDERLLSKYLIDKTTIIEKEKTAGAAGKILIYKYPLDSLLFNSLKIKTPTIYSTDLSQVINGIGLSTGVWVDGIIGQDVLLAHDGIIDSTNKQLLLKPHLERQNKCDNKLQLKNILKNHGYSAVPFKLLSINLVTIDLTINHETGEFILDSGAGSGIINQDSLSKFHLNQSNVISSRQSTGAGGVITLQTIGVNSFEINSKIYAIDTINSLDLSAVVQELKDKSDAQIHGVVGQDLLQKYQAIISYHDNTLYLKK